MDGTVPVVRATSDATHWEELAQETKKGGC